MNYEELAPVNLIVHKWGDKPHKYTLRRGGKRSFSILTTGFLPAMMRMVYPLTEGLIVPVKWPEPLNIRLR